MSRALFDKKFGKEFVTALPKRPGIYTFKNENGDVIYVGKAIDLRRRLSQYRNSRRLKKHKKMRNILGEAFHLSFEELPSELEALLKEMSLIQELRPRWNISGRYSFLYPMVGLRLAEGEVHFCFTTVPEKFPMFEFHGAFRSRRIAGEGFFALMRLLKYVGHPVPSKQVGSREKYSYLFGFRRFPVGWDAVWGEFFKGRSDEAIQTLFLRLLDSAGARAKASEVDEDFRLLKRFFVRECRPLARAIERTGHVSYPVWQRERDPLFLRSEAVVKQSRA